MIITPLDPPEIKLIVPKIFTDDRGIFVETYSLRNFADAGSKEIFVQDNHSVSRRKGTVRGLHFQTPPFAQGKLIRVVRGAIFDVAVDIRRGSPTFGKHASARISAENWMQIFIPPGFAHGLMTLEPDTEILYKVSNFYSPDHEMGLLWNDPALAIEWPLPQSEASLSPRDGAYGLLADLPSVFHYQSGAR